MKFNPESESSIFDNIVSDGEKYHLTTNRFFEVIDQIESGKNISREDIMLELIGDDYDTLSDGKKNTIWTSLIEPDIEEAIEKGVLRRKENDSFEILGS
jgi:hypothetical protein